jgi:hypothetical protein
VPAKAPGAARVSLSSHVRRRALQRASVAATQRNRNQARVPGRRPAPPAPPTQPPALYGHPPQRAHLSRAKLRSPAREHHSPVPRSSDGCSPLSTRQRPAQTRMKCPARFLPNHFRCAHRWAWTAVHVHVLIVPSAMCRALMARSSLRCTTQDGTQTAQGSGKPRSTHWRGSVSGSLQPRMIPTCVMVRAAQSLRGCVSCDPPVTPSSETTVTTVGFGTFPRHSPTLWGVTPIGLPCTGSTLCTGSGGQQCCV